MCQLLHFLRKCKLCKEKIKKIYIYWKKKDERNIFSHETWLNPPPPPPPLAISPSRSHTARSSDSLGQKRDICTYILQIYTNMYTRTSAFIYAYMFTCTITSFQWPPCTSYGLWPSLSGVPWATKKKHKIQKKKTETRKAHAYWMSTNSPNICWKIATENPQKQKQQSEHAKPKDKALKCTLSENCCKLNKRKRKSIKLACHY